MLWVECIHDDTSIYTTCPYCGKAIKIVQQGQSWGIDPNTSYCEHFVRYDPLKQVALFEDTILHKSRSIAHHIKELGKNIIKLGDIYEECTDVLNNISTNIAKCIEVASRLKR